jgi:hypothetical protein
VISIAHLESAHADSFNRPTPDHPAAEAVFADEWEVEKVVNKWTKKLRGKEVVEYCYGMEAMREDE